LKSFAYIFAAVICAAARFAFGAEGYVNGIYYEEKGAGEPVVLIHGGQMDRRMWDVQFDVFATEFRVVRYDIRGFGKSPPPSAVYSNEEDLAALLKALSIPRAKLVGLSLGAAVAVDFTLTHSNSVAALLLVCPGLGGYPFRDKANDLQPIVVAARDFGRAKAAELWLTNPYMSVAMENPGLRPQLRQLAEDNALCWLNNPLLNRRLVPPAYERLKEIRTRTMVFDGARDVSDIHAIVEKLTTEIPGAQKKVFPGAGHLIPMEQPAEFNEAALLFLRQKQRAAGQSN
jgi:3-oxoadipate enol-lactonase